MKKITLIFMLIGLCAGERSFAQGANTLTVTVASNTCTSLCSGNAGVSVLGGTAPYAYSWQPSGGNAATATGLCSGTYTVIAYDAIFNYGTTVLTVTCPSAIFEMEAPLSLSLFPNPAQTSVSLDLSSAKTGDYTFSIVNIFGVMVKEEQLFINRNLNKSIDVAGLPSGVYFIGLRNTDNFYSGKFLKQ